jgi:hypothetical protein
MAELPSNQIVTHVPATKFNQHFAAIAEDLLPQLYERFVSPESIVDFEFDSTKYFNVRSKVIHAADGFDMLTWSRGEHFILDFGEHLVGYVSFNLGAHGVNVDAPARLKLTFGEIPLDVVEDLHPCRSWISTSWVPDEVINVDWLPAKVDLPRRYSFRFIRVDVIDTSPKYKVSFSNLQVKAVTSANSEASIKPLLNEDHELVEIDRVSIATLRDCMQTVFEDGPRRDRRAWIGDLRLQALTNYCTFRDFRLVKRCLYMFAALAREDGSLPASMFEWPVLTPASDYIVDYDVLYGSIVLDYVKASGDMQTGQALWDVIIGSTKVALSHLSEDHVFDSSRGEAWKFLDWDERLHRDAGMHGVVICSLKAINELAELLARTKPFTLEVERMVAIAPDRFYDTDRKVFISGPEKQVSWASQAWLTLAGVSSPDVCKTALLNAMKSEDAVRPLTPYLWHHMAEALCVAGAEAECIALIKSYWGSMLAAGADTFWEYFEPENCRASPYGDVHNNSFCHAWSCTPAYLLRTVLP